MGATIIKATGERIERPPSVGIPQWFFGHTTNFVFIECASCGRCSRNVKAPAKGYGLNPDEPKGWTDVCPDCQSPTERAYVKARDAAMRRARLAPALDDQRAPDRGAPGA